MLFITSGVIGTSLYKITNTRISEL